MLNFLPGPLKGVSALVLLTLNTCFWCFWLFLFTLLKLLIPIPACTRAFSKILNNIATYWIFCNNLFIGLLGKVRWDVQGQNALQIKNWYLVLANHQSWLDIVVLQRVMNRKAPMLKFFLKKELIWVPVLGPAWWALDFPFMKRYSRAFIEKNPHLKGKDLETTRKACEKFRHIPVSIMNFVEGTRFSKKKKDAQASPYKHLLKPKAAGIAFVLGSMGEQLDHILNITIAYPNGAKSLWAFMCGKVQEIKVQIETLPLNAELLGDYFQDAEFREKFQNWLNALWQEKDQLIESMVCAGAPQRTDIPCG